MSMTEMTKALIGAQQDFEQIKKTKTGQVGQGKFQYADLTELYDKTKPALWKHGLVCISWLKEREDGRTTLVMSLMHTSGESLSSYMVLPEWDKPTQMGASLTYCRRYLYASLLGISADEDVDGDDLDESTKKPEEKSKPRDLSDIEILKLSQDLAKRLEFSNTDKLAEYLMKFKKSLGGVPNPLETLCSEKFLQGYEKWLKDNPPEF